jgi:DNA-binding CsgD family transcriptional regulator
MREALGSGLLDSVTSSLQSRWCATGSFSSTSFPIRQLFDALGNSPIGIAICDRSLHFAAVNHKLAEINNIPPEEHPGRCVHEVVGSLASTVVARLEQVLRTRQPLHNAELIGRLGANPDFGHWLENYFPILDDRHRVVQVGVFLISSAGVRPRSDPNRALPGSTVLTGWQTSRVVSTDEQVAVSKSRFPLNADQYQGQTLTGRETDVLRLLANGASSKEASTILAISVKTVETYRARLMLKLHATSVAHLVHYAIRHHVVDLQVQPSGYLLRNNSDFTNA